MMKRVITGVVAAAVVAAAPASAGAQTAESVLGKAIAAWRDVTSMSGTFEQELENPLLRSTTVSHGEFRQRRPNKISIRFTDPSGDVIVGDGTYLWIYLPHMSPDQVIRRPATDRADVPIDISQFLDGTATRFNVVLTAAASVADRTTHILLLTPKPGTSVPFTRALVWVDDADGLIRQFEVTEPSGLRRRIRLTKLTLNPSLPASDFVFTVPKGAKIVDG